MAIVLFEASAAVGFFAHEHHVPTDGFNIHLFGSIGGVTDAETTEDTASGIATSLSMRTKR